MQTIGQYLWKQLESEGIKAVFGVAGDYNFPLLDALEQTPSMQFFPCCNEGNAGFAADGYARIQGMGAVITTFGVGELGVCNAIAGAYSESVALVHIVGAPNTSDMSDHCLLHHTLQDGDFSAFQSIFAKITAYGVVLSETNARTEIIKALHIAKEQSKPVYLVIPKDIVNRKIQKGKYQSPKNKPDPIALQATLSALQERMNQAKRLLVLVGHEVHRCHLEAKINQLVAIYNIPVAAVMMGKGVFDETESQYIGMYGGQIGSEETRHMVETSDCILAIGVIFNEVNTGYFTHALNMTQVIHIRPSRVTMGSLEFPSVSMEDVLNGLIASGKSKYESLPSIPFPFDDWQPNEQKLSASYYYSRIQAMIKPRDILVVDAGTFAHGMAQVRLQSQCSYLSQTAWGSIGYALPAGFGASLAEKDRRTLVLVGDGGIQASIQELSNLLHHGNHVLLFVLNNQGYTIERYLNVPSKTSYNNIHHWNYEHLMEGLGDTSKFLYLKASTCVGLDQAIAIAEEQYQHRLCLIELVVDVMDAPTVVHEIKKITEKKQALAAKQ